MMFEAFAINVFLTFVVLSSIAAVGVWLIKTAQRAWLARMGIVLAVITGLCAVGLSVMILLTFPTYESSSQTIVRYARVSCGSFPDRATAQAFYDAVQDLEYKYEFFDRDRDGIACEPNDDKYHPDEVQPIEVNSKLPVPTPDFGYVSPAPTQVVR